MSTSTAAPLAAAPSNPVQGALQIAEALKAAGFPPDDVGVALVSPDVYPMLTALQLGTVLIDPAVFPELTRYSLVKVLSLTMKYTAKQIADAVAELFGKARVLGPVGGGSAYYDVPQPFDDLAFATDAAQPLTGINLRAGDIIDSLQGVYGQQVGPQHGGNGGSPFTIRFPPGDLLTVVRGYFGVWGAAVYVVQLTFASRGGAVFGPFGHWTTQGFTPFAFEAGPDEQIVALFGQVVLAQRYNAPPSLMVDQLGGYAKPV
jgi:hypothetical protein